MRRRLYKQMKRMLFFRRNQSHIKQKQRVGQHKNRFNTKGNENEQTPVTLSRLANLRDSTSVNQRKSKKTSIKCS